MNRVTSLVLATGLFLLAASPSAESATATVKLVWDHAGAEGYKLYMAEEGAAATKAWQGTEKTASVSATVGKTYRFYVTAYNGALESAPSDILQYTVPEPQQTIIVPGKPTAIRIEFQ